MSVQNSLEVFMERVLQRPLPQNPMGRVRILAKELAEGMTQELWATTISIHFQTEGEDAEQVFSNRSENLDHYLEMRWGRKPPWFALAEKNGYLTISSQSRFGVDFDITKAAFDLLEEVDQATIFISYKRSESSAFALLVLARMKAAGLEPFVDLSLVPGEDWEKGLKERIQRYSYLIALLGKETLKSEVCQREIQWAMEAGLSILPVWHNGFKYESSEWPDIVPALDALLSKTHTIRVMEESALAYNNAIVELLNRFGVTP